jgi:hypothetical protein
MRFALMAGLLLLVPGAALAQSSDSPAATTVSAHYTLDTPIKDLVADPQAKAVLDKDLPGLSSDENLAKFEDKSLRQFQPMTGGQLTDDLLAKTGADLAAIGPDGATAAAPAAPADAPATGDGPVPTATDTTGR